MRHALFVLVLAVCSCKSKEQTTREAFSVDFTCPESAITVTERPDLDADELVWGPPNPPPQEVARDPQRLALWKKQHTRPQSGHVVFQGAGCKHEAFYSCGTSTGGTGGGGHAMCSKTSYKTPTAAPAKPNLSTLGTTKLEDGQWTAIDAPPLVGKLESLDVDSTFDWASSVATAWSADAKLFFLRIDGLAQDGRLDVSHINGNGVTYEFNSSSKGDVDLHVSVRQTADPAANMQHPTGVQRFSHHDTTPRHPIAKPKCTLTQALAALRAKGDLAKANAQDKLDASLAGDGTKATWSFVVVSQAPPKFDAGFLVQSQPQKLDADTCGVVK